MCECACVSVCLYLTLLKWVSLSLSFTLPLKKHTAILSVLDGGGGVRLGSEHLQAVFNLIPS
jgi:hypothetical protein